MSLDLGVYPYYECPNGHLIDIPKLCDGSADCLEGDDEISPLCESKTTV